MGIKNFSIYVEQALRWPTHLYERNIAATVDGSQNKKAVPVKRVSFFDDVIRLCRTRLNIQPKEVSPLLNPVHEQEEKECKTVQGICVDLSSFCYGVIVEEVKVDQSRLKFRRSPSPVPQDVLDSTPQCSQENTKERKIGSKRKHNVDNDRNEVESARTMKKKKNDIFGYLEKNTNSNDELDAPSGTETNTTAACSKDKPYNSKTHTMLKSTIVETVLDDRTIDVCAVKCYEKLFSVIGEDRIANAHYFSLHFDENATSCKWYEQYKRRVANQIIVAKESRCRIFLETIKLVQTRLVGETKARLIDAFRTQLSEHGKDIEGVRLLHLLTSDEFVNDVVLEKMRLSRCGPGADIRRQRFVSGEGEWKCFYTICDIQCEAKEKKEENIHHEWYVFGNDSDIGLGVLLYSNEKTKIHYVNKKNMLSFPDYCLSHRLNVYRALHMLALNLLGNDYVPRLVNQSEKNIQALGAELQRMIHSDEECCVKFLNILSNLFLDKYEVYRENSSSDENSLQSNQRLEFAQALAYVYTRLLCAVYDGPVDGFDRRDSNSVETYFARYNRQPVPIQSSPTRYRFIEKKSLRCRDGKNRTFPECFAAFASCSLWYVAYCLFYIHMDLQQRQEFQVKHLIVNSKNKHEFDETSNGRLFVSGLPMKTPFMYNEQRLHQMVQFEFTHITDVRSAIKEKTTCTLIGIMEEKFLDVLEK